MEEDFVQLALSRASAAYRALIVVGPGIPPDKDPVCILGVLLCDFSKWLATIKLQRP